MKNLLFISLILILTTSCRKSNVTSEEFKLKTKPIEIERMKLIFNELKDAKVFNLKVGTKISQSIDPIQNQEEQVAVILEPLVINGKELQTELLSIIENSNEWEQIPDADKQILLNLSNEQLADLSITYSFSGINGGAIHDCVGVALGFAGLRSLMTGMVTGPTVSTALGILKWVGKRYLSYIGLAWMIWDFMDCVSHF
jgi:hypothetical protein